MPDENERLGFVIGHWLEATKTLLRLKTSEGALLVALQEIVATRTKRFPPGGNAKAAEEMKNIARDAIARQKGGAG